MFAFTSPASIYGRRRMKPERVPRDGDLHLQAGRGVVQCSSDSCADDFTQSTLCVRHRNGSEESSERPDDRDAYITASNVVRTPPLRRPITLSTLPISAFSIPISPSTTAISATRDSADLWVSLGMVGAGASTLADLASMGVAVTLHQGSTLLVVFNSLPPARVPRTCASRALMVPATKGRTHLVDACYYPA